MTHPSRCRSIGIRKNGQSSLEFILIISFMMLIFVGFFAIANSRLGEARQGALEQKVSVLSDVFMNEMELAARVNDGYGRSFTMPATLDGDTYAMQIIDGREFVITYQGYELVEFLPLNVSGSIAVGQNTFEKRGGVIFLNS